MDIQRINPCARWSDATIYSGIVHFVEIAEDSNANMAGQMSQILKQADATLAKCGSDKSRILSVTIYVTDFSKLADLNAIWEDWLPANCAPSRACLKVELVDPDLLVEMAFVAAVA